MPIRSTLVAAALFVAVAPASAQAPAPTPGTVLTYQKISKTRGGFVGALDTNDQLGRSLANLGDLDGDGIPDVAAGAVSDDDGGTDQGAVWILFLNRDGTVKATQKISAWFGNFTGDLDPGDQFGRACGAIGDVDGDGVVDLAVGANFDDDGGGDRGAVWILFLNRDGTVKAHQKISSTQGNFTAALNNFDEFGRAFAPLGDWDGNGVPDLAVGAPYDDDGAVNSGAIYLLFLNRDGTVLRHQKISQTSGNLPFTIGEKDYFGWSLASLDLDLDGTLDLVTGEVLDDAGAINVGTLRVLFLNPDGTVREVRSINQLEGGFSQTLEDFDQFGVSLAVVGDLDGDGVPELAVGAVKFDDGAFETGAVFLLFLRRDGTVRADHRIGRAGGLSPIPLRANDWFGSSLAAPGDLDLDGTPDLLVGARNDDDGGSNLGALYTLFLAGGPFPPTAGFTASPLAGEAPLVVTFQDTSLGALTSWSWDFGDGTTSTLSSPTHTYELPGTYSVTLTVANSEASHTLLRPDLVQVRAPVIGSLLPLGCGGNPLGSLTLLSGEPRIGQTLTFGVDNPLGTQNPGAVARLAVSTGPDAAYPCGTLFPRLGMSGTGNDGEVLIDLAQILSIETGAPWNGPGLPLFVQGLLVDKRATTGPRIGLASGFEIRLGP